MSSTISTQEGFHSIITALPLRRVRGQLPERLSGLSDDSRDIGPGDGFVAVAGSVADGHRYIAVAIERGARVIFCERFPVEREAAIEEGLCVVELDDTRQHLPALARAVYGDPSRSMTMFGVTGTNGKTTITHLIESIGTRLGYSVGVIGTIAHRYPGFEMTASNTTPGILLLARLLYQMKSAGVDWVAIEVSSHGLEQGRLENTHFDAAIWTHLGRDHLDFHGSMQAYLNTKLQLFDRLLPASLEAGKAAKAFVNYEDEAARAAFGDPQRSAALGARLSWYGAAARPTMASPISASARDLEAGEGGIRGLLSLGTWEGRFTLPMLGHFNLLNALGAVAAIDGVTEAPRDAIVEALSHAMSVPGRMEHLGGDGRPHVLIDYAHTPEALSAALLAARAHAQGRVIAVFGAGGDRDPSKRPRMGRAAAMGADQVVITSDNPRSESPAAIASAVLAGVPEARRGVVEVVLDRGEAVRRAVHAAGPLDTVVVAGKGHEDYQIVKGRRLSMDDRELVNDALAGWRRVD